MTDKSQTKWTAGPWIAHPDDQGSVGGDAYVLVTTESFKTVARVQCYSVPELNDLPFRWNCHLISAAPELYEALEIVSSERWGEIDFETFDKIDAVLAKARGEQS